MCHDLFWHSMLTLNKPIVYFAKKDDKQNERDLQMHYLYKKKQIDTKNEYVCSCQTCSLHFFFRIKLALYILSSITYMGIPNKT